MVFCYICWLILWFGQMANRVDLTPIVGGQIVKTVGDIPKYPYMVSLQDRYEATAKGLFEFQHFCGGSLINSKWILTAAHCIWRKKLKQIVAVIGQANISSVEHLQRYDIDSVEYIYFQPTNYQNDIALLRLQAQYTQTFVALNYGETFAKLPKYGMRANRRSPCKIVGYGAKQHAGDIQTSLIEGEVYVITNKQCRQILGHIWAPQNGENTICALGSNQDTCQGDSGGPLICNYSGQDYIYGIVSHGLTCGITNIPSIYTVTIPYVEWIELIIEDRS